MTTSAARWTRDSRADAAALDYAPTLQRQQAASDLDESDDIPPYPLGPFVLNISRVRCIMYHGLPKDLSEFVDNLRGRDPITYSEKEKRGVRIFNKCWKSSNGGLIYPDQTKLSIWHPDNLINLEKNKKALRNPNLKPVGRSTSGLSRSEWSHDLLEVEADLSADLENTAITNKEIAPPRSSVMPSFNMNQEQLSLAASRWPMVKHTRQSQSLKNTRSMTSASKFASNVLTKTSNARKIVEATPRTGLEASSTTVRDVTNRSTHVEQPKTTSHSPPFTMDTAERQRKDQIKSLLIGQDPKSETSHPITSEVATKSVNIKKTQLHYRPPHLRGSSFVQIFKERENTCKALESTSGNAQTLSDKDAICETTSVSFNADLCPRNNIWPNPALNFERKMREHNGIGPPERLHCLNTGLGRTRRRLGLLAEDARLATTGFRTSEHEHDSVDFDDRISDTGVAKEGIRAAQGIDELVDWDGKRLMPGPCDWENERPKFNDSFVPQYIKEWRADTEMPFGSRVAVAINESQFLMAKESINNGNYDIQILQPDSIPDAENSENNHKRVVQTSDSEAANYKKAYDKRERRLRRIRELQEMQTREIISRPPEPNRFAPKIALYARPVELKDAGGIAEVYNYWINNSIIPEDQEEMTVEETIVLVQSVKRDNLPFIVAISGRAPAMTDAKSRRGDSNQAMLPQVERIIGFAFAERLNYSFSAKWKGRSRFTCNLQLYVHPQFTRKGVGRNLMDRLMHILSRAYAYKNAADWVNPRDDSSNETEGCGTFHQLLINVPVEKRNDQTLEWLGPWLFYKNSFWFKEHYRMKSIARSNPNSSAGRWLDIAIFQCEATGEGVFGPYE